MGYSLQDIQLLNTWDSDKRICVSINKKVLIRLDPFFPMFPCSIA